MKQYAMYVRIVWFYSAIAIVSALMYACVSDVGIGRTYKLLSASKTTIETAASTAKELHAKGVIDDVTVAKIKEAYDQLRNAQGALIDLQLQLIDSGELASNQEKVRAYTNAYLRALTRFLRLALEVGLLSDDDVREVTS